ncbi:MAG: phenylalanine--tRNA ligase subunit beta [Cyanobacterium sp. T60_A2020_053]|nr:phenylalanine--tRNA ligase subunit beta [Cyanobacterium sp. T60_A2020_053]
MRISFQWLQELVEIKISPEELAQTLTLAGFEVEDMEDRRPWADGVVIGRVLKCERHPNADKLSLCQVDIGEVAPSTIVCGAPNVRQDIFVPVATLGTYLPQVDIKIKPAKLRGVESKGMICSLAELGLAKESEGIKIFEGDLQVGQDVRPLLGLDDVILDVTATANRADALSMVGIAREISALLGGNLTLPTVNNLTIASDNHKVGVEVTAEGACSAYIATVLENVTIKPSPDWLKSRLEASGVRAINNIVDITNYILLEWGQPLHAFDGDKLKRITSSDMVTMGVRLSDNQETLTTLDGQKRTLTEQNLIITANNHPVALAGIMGGEDSEVDDNTTNIILEGALFEPVPIRRSARRQSLRTEASTRYERGVNQVELEKAVTRALNLMVELTGAEITAQVTSDNRQSHYGNTIVLRLDYVNQVLGKVKEGDGLRDVNREEVEKILTDLNCELTLTSENPVVWQVVTPPYRYRDLEREIDLIEEVARLYGYDRFTDTLPPQSGVGYLPPEVTILRKIRSSLQGLGLTELMQYSLVSPQLGEIKIANPLFSEYSALRRNLIDGLINTFEYNQAQGNGSLKAFEIGQVFWLEDGVMREGRALGGILGGNLHPDGIWVNSGKPQPMTWYEAKGILESLFNYISAPLRYEAESGDERLHPGRTASLWLHKTKIGIFGQLHPQLCQARDLANEVYVFELNLEPLLKHLSQKYLQIPTFKAYSPYPSVARDLAFFAPVEVTVGALEGAMRKAGGKTLVDVKLFDEYKGEKVEAGKRSLAFSLAYNSPDGTLTDQEVDPIHNKVREKLVKEFAVTLRS